MRSLSKVVVSVFIGVCILFAGTMAYADETSEIILRVLVSKGLISEQDVADIRAEVAAAKESADAVLPSSIEERVVVLEGKADDKGFLSKKGVKVQISGKAEVEFVDGERDSGIVAQRDATTTVGDDDASSRFQVDKVVLRITVSSEDERIGFTSEFEFDENQHAFFDDAYVYIKDLEWFDSWARVGLMSRWMEMKHHSETYPLTAKAFFEDEEYMLALGGSWKSLYWIGSIANGLELDDTSINDGNGDFEIIVDDRNLTNISGVPSVDLDNFKEIAVGLGINYDSKDNDWYWGQIDLLGWYMYQQLTDEDIAWLRGTPGYGAGSTRNNQDRWGGNLDYKIKKFGPGDLGVRSQMVFAQDGEMHRTAFHIEPYYTIPIGWRYLDSLTPSFTYSDLNVGLANNQASARTWNREKYTLSLNAKINKNLTWKNEYTFNDENSGNGDVDNNEFISQLVFVW